MGWFGYNIYDGDGTSECHENFLVRAKIAKNSQEASDMFGYRGLIAKTRIPVEKQPLLRKNIALVLKKMPRWKNPRSMEEWDLIEWQMLLSLFVDNNIRPTKEVFDNGIAATEELCWEHADDFDYPAKRRKVLNGFIEKAKKLYKKKNNG